VLCILYHETIFTVVLVVILYPCTQPLFPKLYSRTCILNSDGALNFSALSLIVGTVGLLMAKPRARQVLTKRSTFSSQYIVYHVS
jgi:hypothetical protein